VAVADAGQADRADPGHDERGQRGADPGGAGRSTSNLSFEVPDRSEVEMRAFELLTPDFIRKHFVLPLRFDGKMLVVGMSDPANVFLLDDVKRKTKRTARSSSPRPPTSTRVGRGSSRATTAADVKVDEIIKDMADDDVQVVTEARTT